VKATGVVPKAELPSFDVVKNTPEPIGTRGVWFKGARHETNVYDRAAFTAGAEFDGPAIVEQVDSTVVVPPGTHVTVDQYMNILMRVEG